MSAVSFPALRQPVFRAYCFGAASLMMADSIEHVISYWMMFEKFHSPALAGFAVISHWVPFLLFSIWSGAAADRYDPRRQIQIGMAIFMAVSLAWGALFITNTLEMWHAVVLLVFHGLAGVIWGPAAQLYIHEIVDPEHLPSAIRLSATARWLGLLMGPAIGGLILLALGPAWGILFNALLYVPFIVWLWKAPSQHRHAPPAVRGFSDGPAAWQGVRGNRVILSMVILVGGASLIVGKAYQAQMPGFAHELGHGDGGFTYSTLFAADAAGALTAGFALESRGLLPPSPRSAFLLAMGWCIAIGGVSPTTAYPPSLGLPFPPRVPHRSFLATAPTLRLCHPPARRPGPVL